MSEETCESALSFVSQVFDDVEKVLSEQPFLRQAAKTLFFFLFLFASSTE